MSSTGSSRSTVHALIVAAGLATTLLAQQAHAQTLTWLNAAGGSAATPGNWSPASVPGAANSLVWNLANTYPVTFTSGTASSLGHTYKRGVLTLTMSSPHTTGTSGIKVGELSGDNSTVTLTTGTWNSSGPAIVGDAAGSTGFLLVNDIDADLFVTGTSDLTVGNNGAGSLTISGQGRVVVADRLFAGSNSTSTSTIVVSGQQNVLPFARSTLDVQGLGDSRIGAGGDATLLVDNGGVATFDGSLTIANGSASLSSVTVEESGQFPSLLTVASTLNIGRNISAGVAAGSGSLIVNTSGSVNIGGVINLGNDPDGGTGLLRLTGSASQVTCPSLNVGAAGTLDLQDGTLSIDGGALSVPPGSTFSFAGGAGARTPTLTLRSGATLNHTHGVNVGSTGNLELRVESGSLLTTPNSTLTLGVNAGSSGSVVVTGTDSHAQHATARIGAAGMANLTIDAGGSVSCTLSMETGALGGGDGQVHVLNGTLTTGTSLVLAGQVSGGGAVGGGAGSLEIGPAGVVNLGTSLLGMGASTVVINGGTLNAVNGVSARFTLNGGTINAASFSSNTPVNARGAINAIVSGGQTFSATGDLSLGNGSPAAFDRCPINVGAFRVDILDSSTALLDDTTIAGGILATSDRFRLPDFKSLNGTGTIASPFINEGDITATGTGGLTFQNLLDNQAGGTLAGTKLVFSPTASFLGIANGGTKWLAMTGSALTFTASTGFTFIGSAVPDAFVCDATLDVLGQVGIGDSDGFDLGPRCTLRGGTIASFTAPFLPNGNILINRTGPNLDRLRGVGTLNAQVVTNIGVISPGFDDADPTGQIDILPGAYAQGSGPNTGTLEFDIEGPAPNQADRLLVGTTATMDGTLRLRVINGFVPPNAFRRTIVQAASVGGGITTLDLPPGWHLERSATTIDAVFCAADFDNDGTVDFFDYDAFVACFEGSTCPPGRTADFDADGTVDFFDYDSFVIAFESGC
ncbi:MAG: hypothetical protein AABZ53_13190 [Planctomycetota bacterium]